MHSSKARKSRSLFIVLALSMPAAPVIGQDEDVPAEVDVTSEMIEYYFVFLRRGPNWTAEATPESRAVSEGHMANIDRLTQSGQMVVAGPFLAQSGENALAGLFILRAESMEEAKKIVQSDPAVEAKRFTYEIVPWLGPSTLSH